MNKLSLEDLDIGGKRVLMRVDFNVPQHADGSVRDDTRIRAALESINYVREGGGRLVLMSHLGRPKDPSKASSAEERAGLEAKNASLKMDLVALRLEELTGTKVTKMDEVVGASVEKAVSLMEAGDIMLLENTRFHPGETKNDAALSLALSKLGDVYVSDAFGTVHRAHASTVGVAHHFDERAAGFLLAREIDYFTRILEKPERPLLAILGGAKVSDKITVIDNLLDLVDTLAIGGGMSYTFLKAQGRAIGDSLLEEEGIPVAERALKKAREKGVEVLLPTDSVVADAFSETANTAVVEEIDAGWQGLDLGPDSVGRFCEAISRSRTVVWNGPLGVFELAPFQNGTLTIARLLAESSLLSVIGGGDTAAAVTEFGFSDRMSHVSTGGGASLEMLEGKSLPGLAVLTDK